MASECRAGNWLFRINPSNNRELQRASTGSTSYSQVWSAPNGEKILDIVSKGDDVLIKTDKRDYVRSKSGGVSPR